MKYKVSFNGFAYVEADSPEEAEEKTCMKMTPFMRKRNVNP